MSILNKKIKSFPNSPGVYIFYGKSARGGRRFAPVLYVGKATALKDRVGSYFTPSPALRAPSPASGRGGLFGSRPIEIMISEVADVKIKKTDTVLEAYILEQDLIKKLQPKYNMDGKDDKSFAYVAVTKEEFPRFIILRKTELSKIINSKLQISNKFQNPKDKTIPNTKYYIPHTKIYGPYTSKKQIEIALKILRKIFPYHAKKERTEKGCLEYQIGFCPGPYSGAISKKDYQKNIRGIRMVLEGKKKSLIAKMKKEMEEYSARHEFEKAASMRNKVFSLQHIQDIALISWDKQQATSDKEYELRIEGYDISSISRKHSTGSMVVFDNTDGEIAPNKSQYRKFKIKTVKGADDVGAMEEMLQRRFKNNWRKPDLIILDGGKGHLNMTRRVLRNYRYDIPIMAVAKGSERKKLDIWSFGNIPKLPLDLIEQIRDEAHRFAISYHRKLRDKNSLI